MGGPKNDGRKNIVASEQWPVNKMARHSKLGKCLKGYCKSFLVLSYTKTKVMKRNIPLVFFILLFFGLQKLAAQTIPNPSFEEWSGGLPVGWYGDATYVMQDTDAHSGNYAARLIVGLYDGFYTSTELLAGNGNGFYYPTTGRPDSFYFWYIFNSPAREAFEVATSGINSSLNLSAEGAFIDSITTLVYKEGIIGYQYDQPTGEFDSMSISFNINPAHGDSGDIPNTYLIVDDLSFNGISGVDNVPGSGHAAILKVQPNPASDKAVVYYNLPASANVALEVYDVTGRRISKLVNGKQTPGTYKAILQTNNLPAGNYFCTLNADGIITTEKIIVVK